MSCNFMTLNGMQYFGNAKISRGKKDASSQIFVEISH